MRRLTIITLLILCACTPTQMRRWQTFHDRRPAAAVAWLDWKADEPGRALAWLEAHYQPAPVPPPQTRLAGMTSCGQWADEAWIAGWRSDGYTLGRVMYAESHCQPGATSSAGARGLMQIMPFWAADCGGGNLYDPMFNLRCALHVLHVQGWGAWDVY
jgi:Transglycosylase SLT domain